MVERGLARRVHQLGLGRDGVAVDGLELRHLRRARLGSGRTSLEGVREDLADPIRGVHPPGLRGQDRLPVVRRDRRLPEDPVHDVRGRAGDQGEVDHARGAVESPVPADRLAPDQGLAPADLLDKDLDALREHRVLLGQEGHYDRRLVVLDVRVVLGPD